MVRSHGGKGSSAHVRCALRDAAPQFLERRCTCSHTQGLQLAPLDLHVFQVLPGSQDILTEKAGRMYRLESMQQPRRKVGQKKREWTYT